MSNSYFKITLGKIQFMKKIIFSALIGLSVISIQGCMTPMTVTSQPMENISKVIEVNGKKQNQIFNESKMWIAESFKSANNVIQYQDEGTGSIIGKGNMCRTYRLWSIW